MSRARFQNLRTKMGGFSTEARRHGDARSEVSGFSMSAAWICSKSTQRSLWRSLRAGVPGSVRSEFLDGCFLSSEEANA
jgi:hypothetical protein